MEGIPQQLRLQVQPGVLHRLADIKTLERQRDLLEHGFDAARFAAEAFAGAGSDFDGDDAVNGGL